MRAQRDSNLSAATRIASEVQKHGRGDPAMAALAAAAIVGLGLLPSPPALLSPYRRPVFLQPRRLFAEGYALYGERLLAENGLSVGRMGVDFEVRETKLRGRGLFALRDFAEAELVTRYNGVMCTLDEFSAAKEAGWTSGVYIAKADSIERFYLDADDENSAPGRFVNHSKLWANSALTSFTLDEEGATPTGVVYVKTEKPVRAGSEFLFDYGDSYWDGDRGVARYDIIKRFQVDYMP